MSVIQVIEDETGRPEEIRALGAARLTPVEGNEILAGNFAPWVRDLGLVVTEVGEKSATLRLPWSARLTREGGALSGQALMAAADTAAVIAISAALGEYGPMTTVQQSITFQRPVAGSDVLIRTEVTKLGRTLAFVAASMTIDGVPDPVAQASTVYAILRR
jgi:uncharacterized protein (TIGR00369 family)